MRILFLMNDEGSPPGVLLEETQALGHRPSVLVPYKNISHDPELPGAVPISPGAHGGRVKPLGHTEWGFLPQTWLPAAKEDVLLAESPPGLPLMQWHGDTFDLPSEAVPLSTRLDCPGQAFRIGEINWGLQFHLELDQPTLLNWAKLHADELKEEPAPHIAQMEKDIAIYHHAQADFARMVMGRWLDVCADAKRER